MDMKDMMLPHDCRTPHQLLRRRAQDWAALPALRRKSRGLWQSTSWAEYYANVRAVGLALEQLGLTRRMCVGILAENRPEWLYADLGAQCMGMISTGIYPTSSPEQIAYQLNDAEVRVLFVENDEQLDKVLSVRASCPHLQRIVVMDWKGLRGFSDVQVVPFTDLLDDGHALACGRAEAFDAAIDAGQADDIAFLVYTSGTTGAPKGAMIANRNLMFQLGAVRQYLTVGLGAKTMSFLPLCHIAERMATVFNQLALGYIVHFPESSATLNGDLREVAPDVLFAPPRFWEKLHAQTVLFMQDAIPLARWAYAYALAEGRAVAEARLVGQSVGKLRALRLRCLRQLVFANVRRFLGLQNVRNALTGAAPVPPDLLKWYMALGIDLLEAFGMTESTGFCTATPADNIKIGYAGVAAHGTQIRLGTDNEILLRGPNIFAGYWKNPSKTAETIDAEGWLHTGDVGAIDADGYLRIVDRLKDILITSGGKNITPSNIESRLKFSPYIADAVVVGDGKHYLTCLVMIDHDNVARHAQDRQVAFTDFGSLTSAAEIVHLIKSEIEQANTQLARVEQIKNFRIIGQMLTAEDEELTPTMKLKRKVIVRKYSNLVDSMYAEARQPAA